MRASSLRSARAGEIPQTPTSNPVCHLFYDAPPRLQDEYRDRAAWLLVRGEEQQVKAMVFTVASRMSTGVPQEALHQWRVEIERQAARISHLLGHIEKHAGSPDVQRLLVQALGDLEAARMWAVKAVTTSPLMEIAVEWMLQMPTNMPTTTIGGA